MAGFPFEEGVLTPLENDRLNTESGFNAEKRCHFCGKPVVEGSEYCKEYMEERQCQR